MRAYYEFLAIDKPLTRRQMGELRAISTRARITSTSFVNYYDWGSLGANPRTLVERYFDGHVYVGGAVARELTFRLPRILLDLQRVKQYRAGDSLVVRVKGDYALLELFAEVDSDTAEWEEGEGWLASLIPLRRDIANGDCSGLYLAWLRGVQMGDVEAESLEPPVPPALRRLSGPLESLACFLDIDQDLIAAAAEGSPSATGPSRGLLREGVRDLPERDKQSFLLRLATGEDPMLRARLLKRLRGRERDATTRGLRTVRQLRETAKKLAEQRHRREAQRAVRKQARRKREETRERDVYLARLAKRQAATWREIEGFIAKRTGQDYDEAAALLVDLRELAVRKNRTREFEARVGKLRARHARKTTLIHRLDRALGAH